MVQAAEKWFETCWRQTFFFLNYINAIFWNSTAPWWKSSNFSHLLTHFENALSVNKFLKYYIAIVTPRQKRYILSLYILYFKTLYRKLSCCFFLSCAHFNNFSEFSRLTFKMLYSAVNYCRITHNWFPFLSILEIEHFARKITYCFYGNSNVMGNLLQFESWLYVASVWRSI